MDWRKDKQNLKQKIFCFKNLIPLPSNKDKGKMFETKKTGNKNLKWEVVTEWRTRKKNLRL